MAVSVTFFRLVVALTGLISIIGCATTSPPREDRVSNVLVDLKTSKGTVRIELWAQKAPKTVASFLQYVDEGFYDGVIFHRVIPGFMVQGGGFTPAMVQKSTTASVENEADNGQGNTRGTLAMARTADPHSASAQFFINLVDNKFLNHTGKNPQGWGYCVFGTVVDGMKVVDDIARVPTGRHGPHADVPTTPVVIEKATRVE